MDTQQAVEKVFQNLTLWRNLPKYQLERRADIFFSLYLKDILEATFLKDGNPVELLPLIIPEFPLKQKDDSNHTANVDYVMFSIDLKTIYLIEFKTDMGSLRPDQFTYLKAAKDKINDKNFGFKKILVELWTVFAATNDKQKYYHLFNILEENNLLSLPNDLQNKLYSGKLQGISKLIEAGMVPTNINEAKIVFIQPKDFSDEEIEKHSEYKLSEMTRITFENVIECLTDINTPFSKLFASYIQTWTFEAGTQPPGQIACTKGN